jgi:KDO2-lipid IV(A) lauroyltransferase
MSALLLKLLFRLFALLPLPAAHALGAALGGLFGLIPNKRRRTAQINLALCFPERDQRARRKLLRRNLIEFGKMFTEIGVLWTRGERGIRRLVRRTSGETALKERMAQGQGLILAMPHLGAWEMVNLYASLHYPLTTLYRNPPLTGTGQIMRAARERFGARLMSADGGGVRALYKALDNGEMIAILPDQVPGSGAGAVFAPFFGIPASTMVLLSRLAAKTGAPVMFAYAERLPWGRGYHLHFRPAPAAINSDNVDTSATQLNAMVEQCVRALPTQYQWVYKRFRVRPPGERAFY